MDVVYCICYISRQLDSIWLYCHCSLDIYCSYRPGTQLAELIIRNNSDIDFICENKSIYNFYNSPHIFTIEANGMTKITVKTIEVLEDFDLGLIIHNAIIAPRESVEVSLPVLVDEIE